MITRGLLELPSLVGFAILLLVAMGPLCLGQTQYAVTNLGALGMSQVRGLNNRGEVVGGNGSRAFLYSGGVITDIGSLLTNTSIAVAINDSGRVVVRSPTTTDPRSRYARFFLYDGGAMSDLGPVGDDAQPTAMEDLSKIDPTEGAAATALNVLRNELLQTGPAVASAVIREWLDSGTNEGSRGTSRR